MDNIVANSYTHERQNEGIVLVVMILGERHVYGSSCQYYSTIGLLCRCRGWRLGGGRERRHRWPGGRDESEIKAGSGKISSGCPRCIDMCNVNKGFKFCTCSDLSSALFTWSLTRYLGKDEDGPVGSIIGPARDLGKGLTAASVLEVLNSGKGFDFDYVPVENDSLRIVYSDKKEVMPICPFSTSKGFGT